MVPNVAYGQAKKGEKNIFQVFVVKYLALAVVEGDQLIFAQQFFKKYGISELFGVLELFVLFFFVKSEVLEHGISGFIDNFLDYFFTFRTGIGLF